MAEGLFRRPAFYVHPERDYAAALRATIKTRMVWEQQVIPRLRETRQPAAGEVLQLLLRLEDWLANVVGLERDELTEVANYVDSRDRFQRALPRNLSALMHFEQERERTAQLEELRSALERCGLMVPHWEELVGSRVLGRSAPLDINFEVQH